jgi:hypothetical protein
MEGCAGGREVKRLAMWLFYGIGAIAIGYLALYAYAMLRGRPLQPGDPIHIFRKPDAPNYSAATGVTLAIVALPQAYAVAASRL